MTNDAGRRLKERLPLEDFLRAGLCGFSLLGCGPRRPARELGGSLTMILGLRDAVRALSWREWGLRV